MKTIIVTVVLATGLAYGQGSCAGVVTPVYQSAPMSCSQPKLTCLCDSLGHNCQNIWVCPSQEPARAQVDWRIPMAAGQIPQNALNAAATAQGIANAQYQLLMQAARIRLMRAQAAALESATPPQSRTAQRGSQMPSTAGAELTLEAVERLASEEEGNANAQVVLGSMYALGRGVRQDYAEAARWYGKAAEQGNTDGQSVLGYMYSQGQGVSQDYAEAAKWFRKAAEQGDATAQFRLGKAYALGQGVPQDYAKAALWTRNSALNGNPFAQGILGSMYALGQGVPQNDAEAARWVRKSAEQGNAASQDFLSTLYLQGRGVPQDYTEAMRWCRSAAEQGHAGAQFKLGSAYLQGQGMPQDYVEAARWIRNSAEQGIAASEAVLGALYAQGQGVPQDYAEAHKWFNLAASRTNGDEQKQYSGQRDLLAQKMTAQQIAEAQRLAREWKPTLTK